MKETRTSATLRELQFRNPELARAVQEIRKVVDATNASRAIQTEQARIQCEQEPEFAAGSYTSVF